MALIQVKLHHADKILAAFKKAPGIMTRNLQVAIEKVGVFTRGKVSEHITAGTNMWKPPINKGAMREGIHMDSGKLKAIVRPSDMTPYASYVHEGTGKMRARPFFEITAQKEKKPIEKFFNEAIKRAADELTT